MTKLFLTTVCALSLSVSVAVAADDEYVDEAVDLEELASRLNVVKPEQYVEMTAPIIEDARRTANSLTSKEAQALVDAQNRVNRRVAVKQGEPEPEPIEVNVDDKQALEEFLTPKMYTYDDLPE